VTTVAPRVSVIVPVRDGGAALGRCLASIRAQDHDSFELIVVDDQSSDGSAELAARYADHVLRSKERGGPGRARNRGAEAARGTIFAFADADTVLPPLWLRRIEAALADPAIGAVASGYSGSAIDAPIARFNHWELLYRRRKWMDRVDTAPGASLAVRREHFEAVSGFPTDLRYASTEDMVFTLRLSRRAALAWDRDNGVEHHFRADLVGYLRQQFNYARPVVPVYTAHRELLTARAHHPKSGWLLVPLGGVVPAALLLSLAVPPLGLPALFGALAASLLPELGFLAFLARHEGAGYAARAVCWLLLRNTAWFGGAVLGALEPLRTPRGAT
jgi:glycosyltransferase involved in cell wall biosynthesis